MSLYTKGNDYAFWLVASGCLVVGVLIGLLAMGITCRIKSKRYEKTLICWYAYKCLGFVNISYEHWLLFGFLLFNLVSFSFLDSNEEFAFIIVKHYFGSIYKTKREELKTACHIITLWMCPLTNLHLFSLYAI